MAQSYLGFRDILAFNSNPSTDLDVAVRSIPILGENPDVDSGTVPETVWEIGGMYVFPTAASVCTIVSSSTDDITTSGTGAWQVLIEGLDSNYKEILEVVALDGTNNVVSVNSYFRVNAFRVVYSGTAKHNVGNITCTVDSKTVRYIAATESLDHTAVYTVAAGHTFFPINVSHSEERSNTSIVTISNKVYVPSTNTIYDSSERGISGTDSSNNGELSFPRIPEKADYYFEIAYASTTNIRVFTVARGLLVKNNFLPKILP